MKKLALVFIANLFLAFGFVPAAFAQDSITSGLCTGANLQFTENPDPNSCQETGSDAATKINNIIRKIINLLSVIVGVIAVLMIIVGGFRYITSGGSDTGVTSAKNTILYAIVGLIIVALAQLIVRFVLRNITQV